MNVFEAVKTSINTREAAARYGVEVNRHGKALCPFHNDRHPSLFVDDDHYHCYACGEHGDVIDFTATAPSIFSVDFSLSGLMLPAGSVRMKMLSIIQ